MGNSALTQPTAQQISPQTCCKQPSLFVANTEVDSTDITCSICFELFRQPRIMKCKHTICSQCISQWGRKQQVTCPFCRAPLKRMKGNFGRMHKQLEKKIASLIIQCRGCSWKGSPDNHFEEFKVNPTLDDDVMPCEKMHNEQVQEEPTQKKEKPYTQIESKVEALDCAWPEKEKQANQKKEPQACHNYNSMIGESESHRFNPYGDNLFLRECPQSPISSYFNLRDMLRQDLRRWDDCFYFGENEF